MGVNLYSILVCVMLLGVIAVTSKLVNLLWVTPKRLERVLREQGLRGNPYRILLGDTKDFISITNQEYEKPIHFSDDVSSHLLPYYHHLRQKYGENCFVWIGPSPKLIVSDPQLLKEILMQPQLFQKSRPDPIAETIVRGLLFLEDDEWAKRRKVLNPTFKLDNLKNISPAMRSCSLNLINRWESLFSNCSNINGDEWKEIDVWPYLENLTTDVISKTVFGNNHERGNRIFELQKEQVKLILKLMLLFLLPGWRFIPTKAGRKMKQNSKEIQTLLKNIISQRQRAMATGETFEEDLLGALMGTNMKEFQERQNNTNMDMSLDDVLEECKLFYFAGSETTSGLLVYTMVMLSFHQEWQSRAREEVLQVFGHDEPTFEGLSHLKIVTMILHEVLRLYSPAPVITRGPTKKVQLGNITLPVGVDLMLLIGMVHHDPKIWGDDVKEFRPERFSEGIASATTTPFSYMPFGLGPRVCIGQQYAMIQAKMVVATILQRFSFKLSESYLHAPIQILTVRPRHGAPLLFRKL